LGERERLLDPTGDGDRGQDTRLASRPRSLAGLRMGILDNGKPNASAFLAAVATELRRGRDVRSSTTYVKGYFGTPVEESQIQRILDECDFVVAGVGD
jgi:predicted component of type VI protein secretion system